MFDWLRSVGSCECAVAVAAIALLPVSGCGPSTDVGSTSEALSKSGVTIDAPIEDAGVVDEDGGVDEDCEDDIEWPEITPIIPVKCDDPNATPGVTPGLIPECDKFSLRYCTVRYIKDKKTGEWKMTRPICFPPSGGLGDIDLDLETTGFAPDDDVVINCGGVPVPWGGTATCECTINPATGELECVVVMGGNNEWPGEGNCCTVDGITHCDIFHSEGGGHRPWIHTAIRNDGNCLIVQTSNVNATGTNRLSLGIWMYCCKDCPEPPDPPGTCTCHPECGTNGLPPCCPAEVCNPPGECSCDAGCGMNGLPPCCPIEWCNPPPCVCQPGCINNNSCCPVISCPPPPGCSCNIGCGTIGGAPCCPVQVCPPLPPAPGCTCDPFGVPIGPGCGTYYGPGPSMVHECAEVW